MRAAVSRSGRLVIEDVPEPKPCRGQVLVAPQACGICGSDLHFLERQRERAALHPDRNRPVVMGHEFCAKLIDTGPETTAPVGAGSLVTSVPYLTGPRGPELLGFSSRYPGGFAELMLLEANLLVPVPADVPAQHAALTEPLAVGLHAVNRAGIAPGSLPCVVGCGPVGLAVISALRSRGHGPILAIDPSPTRRGVAEVLGADDTLAPEAQAPVEDWSQYGVIDAPPSPLLPDSRRGDPRVTIFDCVGRPGLIESIIRTLPRHSRLIVAGVCMVRDSFIPRIAIDRELSVEFVFGYTRDEFSKCLALIADGHFDAESLITTTVDLDGLDQACARLGTDPQEVKVVALPSVAHPRGGERKRNEVRQ